MDSTWFEQALNRVGGSQADLARYLRLAPSAISRMLKGERQMKLAEAMQVATFLQVSQEEVLRRASDAPPPGSDNAPRRRGRPPRRSELALPRPFPPMAPQGDVIPIRSAERGNGEQRLSLEEAGYTPRPANLAGVRAAYAVYMVGDHLAPRYEEGWLLHVHPFKPPTRGRDVVVMKTDHSVMIEQFVGWENDKLVLRQLNPEQMLSIPRDDVAACHLIVGVDQEG
jgi:phage repressor protein C with HTH and peptisase S24 domain